MCRWDCLEKTLRWKPVNEPIKNFNFIFIFTFFPIMVHHQIRSDQSLSHVRLFAIPWIAARQASLSITNSWSSLRPTFIKSVMPSSHLILCRPLLLLPPIPQGCPSAQALSALFHASNLDWSSTSHMVIYRFQCNSLKSSHPHLLPQSPKVCSLYLCLSYCLMYRVIVTIFLNSKYVH